MPRLTVLQKAAAAHEDGVWSAAWVPNSNRLLTGSADESVKHWEDNPDGLKFLHTYQGHILGVVSVVVNPSGEVAASSSLDSLIRVWSLNTHETLALIETSSSETWSITFGPYQDRLQLATAAGTRGSLVLWRVEQETALEAEMSLPGAAEERSRGKDKFVLSVAYSPDGRRLACGAMDGTVALFDVATHKFIGVVEGHHKPVRSLTFTPDSKTLLTACDDMHINLYDVENQAMIESFSGHESWVLSVAAHPTGTTFASGGADAKVKLWDLGARACIQTVTEHTDQVWSVEFSQDGNRLASASEDKSVITYGYA